MTTSTKISVSAASRMPSAISFGVLRRSAPSTRAIIRSRNDWPGSCVISTTMRSESTRVPPVTAQRSPPASRITGADSPVIADSSTEAMPSITVPSPGISSPASTTTTSPRTSSDARLLAAVAQLRGGLGAHRPQRRRLGPPATLRERLGQVGEDDGQPQPDRDREREPGGLVAAAQRLAAEGLDQPRHGGDHARRSRPRTSPGCGPARAGRACAATPTSAGTRMRSGRTATVLGVGHRRLLVEGEVELEDVHAGLAEQAEEAAVGVVVDQLVDARPSAGGGRRRCGAPGCAALACEMCGSTPDADWVTASTGTSRRSAPGRSASRARGRSAMFALTSSRASVLLGPRLLKNVTSTGCSRSATGRGWK